jgi:toxin ParE1/3/4
MATALRTDQAEEDLDKILLELARQSVTAGHRLVQLIAQKAQWYADRPNIGILRDDLAPDLRCFIIWNYLIFYRSVPNGIELLRVIHGSRHITPSQFKPTGP